MLNSSSFHPRRSARDHLRWLGAAAGIARARIDEVLGDVDLTGASDRRVGQFSLGMRQRLGLAAALLGDSQLLILDEPANGLDPAGIRWLREWLSSFGRRGGTVFVSSHAMFAMVLGIRASPTSFTTGRSFPLWSWLPTAGR